MKYVKIIPKNTLVECISILEASLYLPQAKLDKKIKKLLKKFDKLYPDLSNANGR